MHSISFGDGSVRTEAAFVRVMLGEEDVAVVAPDEGFTPERYEIMILFDHTSDGDSCTRRTIYERSCGWTW